MKKPAFKIVLAMALCLVLVFSFASVAQAKTSAAPPIIAYSIYSSCGAYTENTSFSIYADKVWETNGTPISDVQFSIWTKANKSDMRTFSGTRDGDNWRVQINISQFDNYYGKYRTTVTATDALGRSKMLGGVTVIVAPTTVTSTAASFYATATKKGTFTVYVNGVANNANDIIGVNLRIRANGQESTEKWIPMQLVKGDKWRTTVKIADFGNYHGWYTLEAFTVNSNNVHSYISTTYVNVP